jgi:hypothetical protein
MTQTLYANMSKKKEILPEGNELLEHPNCRFYEGEYSL